VINAIFPVRVGRVANFQGGLGAIFTTRLTGQRLTMGVVILSIIGSLALPKLAAATLDLGDGVNLQPSYFSGGAVNLGWDFMRTQPRIRTVRIEIEPSVPLVQARRWLSEAHAAGYKVIATYHHYPANGSDDVEELKKAAGWWRTNYADLSRSAPLTINLMNEWGSHKQTPQSFAAAYNAVLPIVREVYRGPIIVDIPGWAQETYVARDASPFIADDNIVFSVHIYRYAWVEHGSHRWMAPADLDALDATKRPVIIGEFGSTRKGGADWSALVDHAKAKGWTVLAWAWNGDGEGMNMVKPAWTDDPSAKKYRPSSYFSKVYQKLGDAKNSP
jgi:mannan endo-1,4-beta-mannosidase